MSDLLTQQQLFTQMIAELLEWAHANGYELTFGEAWRSPQEAAINAQTGAGITNSLHCQRLAVDFNVFKDGVMAATVADYMPLGVFWETIGGSWGGRFARPDADHFSLEWQGIR